MGDTMINPKINNWLDSLNPQLGPLSEEEIELVMRFRARQARRVTPARRLVRILSLLATSVILVIVAMAFIQAVELENNGYSGEIPAPLSWIAAITINLKS